MKTIRQIISAVLIVAMILSTSGMTTFAENVNIFAEARKVEEGVEGSALKKGTSSESSYNEESSLKKEEEDGSSLVSTDSDVENFFDATVSELEEGEEDTESTASKSNIESVSEIDKEPLDNETDIIEENISTNSQVQEDINISTESDIPEAHNIEESQNIFFGEENIPIEYDLDGGKWLDPNQKPPMGRTSYTMSETFFIGLAIDYLKNGSSLVYKDGYEFDYWTCNGKTLDEAKKTEIGKPLSLKVHWKIAEVYSKITWDENGGSFKSGYQKPTQYKEGTGIPASQFPTEANITKDKHKFLGWKTNQLVR